jgi:hypothetical protein
MMRTGILGGPLADRLLSRMGDPPARGYGEAAHVRCRARFKHDGATCFGEVEGGLNQMTIRRFQKLVAASLLAFESFEAVPIRRLRALATPLTRELFTSYVRCRLKPREAA